MAEVVVLSVAEAAALLCAGVSSIRRKCATGQLPATKHSGEGGLEYRIPLEALPEPAQARYWVGQLRAVPQPQRRAFMQTLAIPPALVRKVAQAAAVPRQRGDAAPEPWTQEEFEQKTAWFNTLPLDAQEEAIRRTQLLWAFEEMEVPEGQSRETAVKEWAKTRGESSSTLYRWRRSVAHLEQHQWCYGLVPELRKGNVPGAPKAEIDPKLWAYIIQSLSLIHI